MLNDLVFFITFNWVLYSSFLVGLSLSSTLGGWDWRLLRVLFCYWLVLALSNKAESLP